MEKMKYINQLFIKNPEFQDFLEKREKILSVVLLCFSIYIIWVWVYNRVDKLSWETPLSYGGDTWLILGLAKAYMDGDIAPILMKSVEHLNAPFSANWNDWPVIEEWIFAMMGWLGKVVGLFTAANLMLMLAHILAGLGFWYVGRELKYRPAFVFAGAILFAFPHYIFSRGLPHLNLSYYWHIPLMLLVSWWAYSSIPTNNINRKWFLAIAIALISGVFSVYYTWMFVQFLGFAILIHVSRKQYNLIKFPLILIAITAVAFLIMNADTLVYSFFHGKNSDAVSRHLSGLEVYGLKLPELVFPTYHSWHRWAQYGQTHYFQSTYIKGEIGSPYLGLIGLIGLVWLTVAGLYRFLQGKFQLIPVHAWQILWIILFSVVGGINLLLGTFGLILFRGTNRYSIFILAIALLFLVRQLSRKCPEKWVVPLALIMAIIGLWDQLPSKASAAAIQQTATYVQADRSFSQQLESQLPENSMVFQLPVADFPEIPPIVRMADYEHFRPYLFTQNLHYSYGTTKGRGDAKWQAVLSQLTPAEMVDRLESYGFGAILINRKGYEDRGTNLIGEILKTHRKKLIDHEEWIVIKLSPATSPVFP